MLGLIYAFIFVVYNQQTREYHFRAGVEDNLPFLKGLFGPEKNDQFAFRWTSPVWSVEIPNLPQDPYKLRLVLLSPKSETITLLDAHWNQLQKFTASEQLQEFNFTIPDEAIHDHSLQLNITSPSFAPGDKRLLGVVLTQVDLVQQKEKGLLFPSFWLAGSLLELGLVVNWLITGLYQLLAKIKKRPFWPSLIGLLVVIVFYLPVLFFPIYNNNFELRNLLDIPVFGLWLITGWIYLYLAAGRLRPLIAHKYPRLHLTEKTLSGFEWKRDWPLFAGIGVIGSSFLFFSINPEIIPHSYDIDIYYKYGNLVVSGAMPYQKFNLEYPPVALIFFILPSLIVNFFRADLPQGFLILFELQYFFLTLFFLIIMWKWLQKLQLTPKFNRQMWIVTISTLILSCYIFGRFDIGPTLLVTLSFYLIFSNRPTLGGAVLGLGTIAKLYPALFLPLLIMYYWRNKQAKQFTLRLCIGFGIACVVTTLPFIIFGLSGLLSFLQFHSERGLEIESLYSSLIWVSSKLFGLPEISTNIDHGALNLVSTWSLGLAHVSTYIVVGGVLVFYAYSWWASGSRRRKKLDFEWLLQAAFIITVWFIISNKVLSPQYMIWLLPFVAFLKFNKIWLLGIVLILSTTAYPFMSKAFQDLEGLPMNITLARNIFLLVLFVWQLLDFIKDSSDPPVAKPLKEQATQPEMLVQ